MPKTKIISLALFKTCIFIHVVSIFLLSQKAIAQDLDEALLKKDLTISLGGGKNRYYIQEFQLFAPLSLPLTVNYAFFKSFELGLMYQPSFFNDRSNADFQRGETAKNQSLGGVQSGGFNSKISLFNENGILAFVETGLLFSELKKNQFIEASIQKDIKFRNALKGMVIGLFTVEEYAEYLKNSSNLNKRMMNMLIERLKSQLMLFESQQAS